MENLVPVDLWNSEMFSMLPDLSFVGLLIYSNWKCFVSFILASTLWYYLFWKPFDYYRDFTEFGFLEAKRNPSGNKSDTFRKNLINELRNRRKIGEMPPVYPNGWFVCLESRELSAKSCREISCLGLNLVAWRGDSGKSYVADAYCPHLGAHLGVGGEVKGECIKCPFHGWTFEGKAGKCVDIPYSDTVPEFAKLKIWETMELNGFIYLWYHAEGESPNYFPDPIPEIATGEWKYRGRSEFRVACHVQEIPENGADVSHLNIVHRTALLCGGKPAESMFSWDFLKHDWGATWVANPDQKLSYRALMTVEHNMNLFGRFSFMSVKVQAHQVGPGMVYLIFEGFGGKGVLFFMTTPLEPLLQKITHSFYSSSSMLHPFGLLILLGEAIQLERDIGIWNRKTFISRPLLTKEDKAIKAFRRWFSQFYSENSPRYNYSSNSSGGARSPRENNNDFKMRDLSF